MQGVRVPDFVREEVFLRMTERPRRTSAFELVRELKTRGCPMVRSTVYRIVAQERCERAAATAVTSPNGDRS